MPGVSLPSGCTTSDRTMRSEMARILVITNMYPPHHYGGYELACRDVVGRWRRRGHEVTVLTTTMRLPGGLGGESPRVRRQLDLYYRGGDLDAPPRWQP